MVTLKREYDHYVEIEKVRIMLFVHRCATCSNQYMFPYFTFGTLHITKQCLGNRTKLASEPCPLLRYAVAPISTVSLAL